MLSINISELVLTIISFFLLLFLLNKFLYQPVLKFMKERQARIDAGLEKERGALAEIAESEKFSKDGDFANAINMFLDVDLLVIDDVGSEVSTEFARTVMFRIIDGRLRQNQSTIITTNLTFEQMKKFYDYRIVSRILGLNQILNFDGTDLRIVMRKQKEEARKNGEPVYRDFSDFVERN